MTTTLTTETKTVPGERSVELWRGGSARKGYRLWSFRGQFYLTVHAGHVDAADYRLTLGLTTDQHNGAANRLNIFMDASPSILPAWVRAKVLDVLVTWGKQ